MIDCQERIAFVKRRNITQREQALQRTMPKVNPIVKKTAKAISDWHSEADWDLHIDKGIRAIEAIAELLNREGHIEASDYLRKALWLSEPKPRTNKGATS